MAAHDASGSKGLDAGVLVPDEIVLCAQCGYDAWREGYPCNRCGGLEPARYRRVKFPTDPAVAESVARWDQR